MNLEILIGVATQRSRGWLGKWWLYAFLGAACAAAQPVTIGYLVETGALAPAGTYANGKWSMPTEKTTPREWTLAEAEHQGTKVRTKARIDGLEADKIGPPGFFYGSGWSTDFSTEEDQRPFGAKVVGVVASRDIPVVVFSDQTKDEGLHKDLTAFISRSAKAHLDSWFLQKHLRPTKIWEAPYFHMEQGRSSIDGRVYSHIQQYTLVHDPKACPLATCDDDFNFIISFEAWIMDSGGNRELLAAHSQFNWDEQNDMEHNYALGVIILDRHPYVLVRQFGDESESAVILDLSRNAQRVLPRNLWFSY